MKTPTTPTKETSDARSGGAFRLRRLSVMDEEGLRRMFSRLSEKTMYHRFHAPYSSVPEWMVSHLSNTNREGAELLVAVSEGGIVGHAMFVTQNVGEAEFAVVVEDAWQSQGVGKSLLFRLALEAERRGVETFTATVLGENRRVVGLLEAAFPKVECRTVGGAFYVRIPLSVPPDGVEARRVSASKAPRKLKGVGNGGSRRVETKARGDDPGGGAESPGETAACFPQT